MVNNILGKIEADKEILSTLPQNNDKNIDKYLSKIDELKKEYGKYKIEILNEMKKRCDKTRSVKKSPSLIYVEKEVKELEESLYLFNDIKTSYEKMGLDKIMNKLNKFYKENLDNINQEIMNAINKFKEVGIELQLLDFDYSSYVTEYMSMFLEELKNGDINSKNIKNKFEELYWKCTDLIIHIELNFRHLYLKNQAVIDKYFIKQKEDLLINLNLTQNEIVEKHIELKKQLKQQTDMDKATIITKFLNGTLNIKDFSETKLKENYSKIISQEILENMDKNKLNELNANIIKFLNSLYEYKQYLNFSFIFENIKKEYAEKEKYKAIYHITKKQIEDKEKKLKKINNKINGKGIFKKKKTEKQNAEYNNLILEIKKLYKELDKNEVYNKIYEKLNDNSTIYDVLYFANSFYNYLFNCIIKNSPDNSEEEVENLIAKLGEYIKSPYNTIINNITLLEKKDLPIIIKDRYQLANFNLTKEDLAEDNIDNLITILSNIETSYNIKKLELDTEDIEDICAFERILNKQ